MYKTSQYFSKPYKPFGGDINVKVDLSNYATKSDLKNILHVGASSFALKSNLASLKTELDKLDIDKLTPVPNDLAKLSDVVKNDVVKKTDYNKLVTKVDNIDTTGFVSRTKYKKDGSDLEKKISDADKTVPDVSDMVKKTDFNAKITEVEGKIRHVSSLVKKTNYSTKISEIENMINDHNHDKYITTPEFNTMAASVFNARLAAQTDLIKKTEFDAGLKKISDRVTSNKSKHLLVENELKN